MASKPKSIRQLRRGGRNNAQSAGDARKAQKWAETQQKMLAKKRDPELKK